MGYVVVVISPDGTVSVVGSKHARPFGTYGGAVAESLHWDADEDGRQVEVCAIDRAVD